MGLDGPVVLVLPPPSLWGPPVNRGSGCGTVAPRMASNVSWVTRSCKANVEPGGLGSAGGCPLLSILMAHTHTCTCTWGSCLMPGSGFEKLGVVCTAVHALSCLQVFDEADRMFDMGFEPQVRSIIGQIRPDRCATPHAWPL